MRKFGIVTLGLMVSLSGWASDGKSVKTRIEEKETEIREKNEAAKKSQEKIAPNPEKVRAVSAKLSELKQKALKAIEAEAKLARAHKKDPSTAVIAVDNGKEVAEEIGPFNDANVPYPPDKYLTFTLTKQEADDYLHDLALFKQGFIDNQGRLLPAGKEKRVQPKIVRDPAILHIATPLFGRSSPNFIYGKMVEWEGISDAEFAKRKEAYFRKFRTHGPRERALTTFKGYPADKYLTITLNEQDAKDYLHDTALFEQGFIDNQGRLLPAGKEKGIQPKIVRDAQLLHGATALLGPTSPKYILGIIEEQQDYTDEEFEKAKKGYLGWYYLGNTLSQYVKSFEHKPEPTQDASKSAN
ncbi:MAG: hypothetical protein K2Y18_00165 [Alphaproteobacteria bacterium]|jgi:hypothetical protein|nr:hypothetical protein [Alphaproteobacteria bacterium]